MKTKEEARDRLLNRINKEMETEQKESQERLKAILDSK
jgi:hypothetical protein